MQFIDKVKLKLKAGNGGNGIVAFKREKYNPLGGPSGGDGGNGGSIIFKVDTNKSTLLDLRFSKMIRAQDGENGKGNNMYGASRQGKLPLQVFPQQCAGPCDFRYAGRRKKRLSRIEAFS